MFNFILYTIYTLLFAFASVASVQYISTFASGSGVPQMKSMIGGSSWIDIYPLPL
jgi:H+/Cl- antiporter ClcA